MKMYSVIGKRLPRLDGIVKATGEAEFTVDMMLPKMLHGKILRSPHPHAKILHIDTSKAMRLPGVKAVLTGEDTPKIKYGTIDMPDYPNDKYPLAVGKVRYIGDDVAAVAATDEDTAMEALELIEVDYEMLPPVFDPVEAMKPDAPRVHDHADRNICAKIAWDFGDIEKGFKDSDHIRKDRFTTSAVQHCTMEPHASLAIYENSGKITVWDSTQTPYMRRTQLAKTLNMPESMIKVANPYVGGGFGGKTTQCCPAFQAALLSIKTGRPVKIVYTREEVFGSTLHRHPFIIDLKTGVKKDGTLMAIDCELIAEGGAYTSTGPIVIFLAGAFLVTTYRISNVKFRGFRVYTNNPISGPQRGHGAVQPRYAADSQLDMIAQDLGLDPIEIRLKNALQPGDVTPNRFIVKSCGLREGIQKVAEDFQWKERMGRGRSDRGIGMGCGAFISGMCIPPHTASAAFVKVHEDGGITLLTGASDIGQGVNTALSQIVADELGVRLEDIRITSGDTELTPVHAGSYSSRGTLWGGKAVREAALDAKKQLLEVVAKELEANVEDLEARDRRIYVKGSPERGMSFKDAVVASFMSKEGNPILGRGYYRPDIDYVNFETGEGNLTPAYSFGAQAAEVIVDRETGRVKFAKMTAAHDSGLAINPMSIEGQLEGSISMGHGQVLLEELLMENGQVMNPNFLDYKLPLSVDSPTMKCIIVDTKNPEDPFEPKEAGEGTQISTPAAIANAVTDAIGIRIKDLPITPEKILEALE